MDAKATECGTCRARGEFLRYHPLTAKGTLRWKLRDDLYSEEWDTEKRPLPTLCVRCAAKRCPHCGK